MNADRLLAHYERIADAPDAIARLRRFILDLAVRGKLVPQDSSEEAAKGFRKPTDPAAPFELPGNWKWIEIGDQFDLLNGMAFKPTDWSKQGLRIVRIQNLNNPDAPFNFCNPEMARDRSLIDNGSFLISWSGTPGTSFGAFVWNRGPAVLNQHIFRCDFKTKAFIAAFLRLAINGRLDEMIAKAHGGVGLQHITKGRLEALLIPLPPLAEQHRIISKVVELTGLCDRLEVARAGREAARDRLAAASLARLNAPDPETFQPDARFALDALPTLTTRPDQIKALRQTILNLAVRGKLFEGTTAKAASVGDYRTLQNGYAFKSSWFSKEGVRLLRNANIGHGEIRWSDVVHLPADRLGEFERFQLSEGDIVLTLDRPFIVTGTKVAHVSADDLPSLLLQRVGRFVETSPGLDDEYLFLWINSPHFNNQIDPGRSNGVPHISSKQVETAEIFVPPLAEQHRIVAKVNALMALCDRLEAGLTAIAATRRQLLNALLADALAPAEDREMEAAE
ncbi:restriction endonuclease subunit S [Mesorhizobium kowhaii]|uniref:restriction endonuclease subunit S n=1 Tax=Mesorhizobium kowhaii TaxID=1300272 RepID=UPI0035F01B08